jgi:gliding motility-associated-like protein
MNRKPFLTSTAFLCCLGTLQAQPFAPVAITGYNQDVVAESGTSSLTTTTLQLDGGSSNKVMYTQAFRTNMGFTGGGIPNNGLITTATANYQMAPYNGNNCFLIQRGQNRDVTLAAPGNYSAIRLLAFSTEGTSLLNITLSFTDGTTATGLSNYSLGDWFNGNTNLVVSGIGRCTRATPATGADGFPSNPRMYFIEIPLNCANMQKSLQKINVANATTAGTNAPFPNTVILALSGRAYTPTTVTANNTSANCSGGGSSALTIAGMSPFTVSWNTSPAQTGPTATNLAQGNYTATITNASNCVTSFPVTIGLVNNLTMNQRPDTTICQGGSFVPNIVSNATNYSWSPSAGVSNTATANPALSPNATTQYTVTGTTGNCTISRSFTVAVNQGVTVNAGPDKTIIQGDQVPLQATGTAGTYLWTPATALSATNIPNPIANPLATTTYTLRITTAQGCTNTDDVTVTVVPYCVKPMEAFTPNGDGINDRWLITKGNCLTKASVRVYNRYGSKVFESQDYKNNWDGTYKGKPLPDGTYYFVIEYELINGRRVPAKGDVTILR